MKLRVKSNFIFEIIIFFSLFFVIFTARAETAGQYPYTTQGIDMLVRDISKELPETYSDSLERYVQDWKEGKGVRCIQANGEKKQVSCYPDAKSVVLHIQNTIFKADGMVIAGREEEWLVPGAKDLTISPNTPLILKQNIPNVVDPSDAETRLINDAITSSIKKLWEQAGGPTQSDAERDKYLDLDLDYVKNDQSEEGILSIKLYIEISSRIGSRGTEIFDNFNFYLRERKLVEAKDVFVSGSGWCPLLAQESLRALRLKSNGSLPQWLNQDFIPSISPDLSGIVCDPDRWVITQGGLEVDFELDEVGGYSAGMPSIVVPWSSLRSVLSLQGLAKPWL